MRSWFGVALCALAITVPVHAGILVGAPADPGSGNCYPFGCLGISTNNVYQQVYNSNNFAGITTITGLTFFHTQESGGGNLNSGTYNISLSTTSKAVNGLDTPSFDNNDGLDNTLIFSGTLPASVAFGSSFTLSGGSFTYDPANGNLLMDVRISGISHTGRETYLDARNGSAGTIFSRVSNFTTGFTDGWGLVTQFETGTSVPEPGTISLLLAGLLGLPLIRRVRS